MVRSCPPGVICLTPNIITGAILLAVVMVAVMLYLKHESQPQQIVQRIVDNSRQEPTIIQTSGDDRYTRAPKPERHWITQPDLPTDAEIYGKLPRIPTRGIPETYQSMGIITMSDGKILPLYGRRTASRSDRFQYYTRTDTYNPVQLPIKVKRRDCQDDVGCEELYNEDEVSIASMGKGKTTIYRFDGPAYIPGII
jgi:hypothetical protein